MMRFPDANLDWKETDLQKAAASFLDDLEHRGMLAWSHPPNEGKRTMQYAVKLKQQGVKAGEPDCIIYLKGGQTLFIELKKYDGTVSKPQKARHELFRSLGYAVHIVKERTPQKTVNAIERILRGHGVSL